MLEIISVNTEKWIKLMQPDAKKKESEALTAQKNPIQF